ncbi:hypothetical protein K2Q16_02700 [Patescibacteria group bacterium]|nr:hypothetical protein [Patescibacteria group bacterium]
MVYTTRLSFLLLALLMTSFFLQPFYRANAQVAPEVNTTNDAVEVDSNEDAVLEPLIIDIPASAADGPAPTDLEVGDISEQAVEEPSTPDKARDSDESGELVMGETLAPTEPALPRPDDTSSSSSSELGTTSPPSALGNGENNTFPDAGSNEELGTSTATSTVLADVSSTTTFIEAGPLVHESFGDGEVRFAKDNCVLVDGGAYYCQTKKAPGTVSDAIIAEPDSGGDLEIFVVKNGEYHQISNNYVDDAAPFYDGRSKSIVWHRLLNDRYVIVSYEVESGKESVITDGEFNDMEPTRSGTYTVWQRWVDGFWHVMVSDGETVEQLTTAANHHVAPHIRGDLILWHTSNEMGNPQLQTYDLVTGTLRTIDDAEGAAMSNPRMMMVYEAVYDNGDVVMRGMDLVTGKISALGVVPASLPDELPDSESTGETRALIQNKSQEHDGEFAGDEPEPEGLVPSLASTSESLTIDLRLPQAMEAVLIEAPTSTPFDLYIAPATSTQNSLEL